MKEINNFEGFYTIYEDGNIWSHKTQKFLIPVDAGNGYLRVTLCKDGIKKNYLIHRLVAEMFIPNPDNLPEVNHISEDKSDNSVSNLEWCDHKYNINYGTRNERVSKAQKGEKNHNYGKHFSEEHRKKISKANSRLIYCVELDREFYGAREAGRQLGLNYRSISLCCNGKLKSTGGYHWRYKEGDQ